MTKGFRFAAVLGMATAVLGGTAASAGAATVAPTSHSFGSHNVGVTSGAQAFTLTNGCAVPNPIGGGCLIPEFTAPGIGVTGDFAETNDCPSLLLTTNGQTCTINVTFTPTTTGERLGTLTTGGGAAALSGTGTTPTVVPPPPPESPTVAPTPTKKKCKKGFKKKKVKGKVKCVKKKKK